MGGRARKDAENKAMAKKVFGRMDTGMGIEMGIGLGSGNGMEYGMGTERAETKKRMFD